MTPLVPIALYGWPLVVLALFALLQPRRAVIASFVLGWLFLPVAGFSIQGFPDYTKMTATCYGVMLGVLLFDSGRLVRYRPHWIDSSMVIWCTVPFVSSITNGLGVYDGFAEIVNTSIVWGLPYFIGRLYFNDLHSMRELATGIFIGGLVYLPLCLWEIRMSPQLHETVYGFHPRNNWNVHRWGGWRPRVFMESGLALGMWMTAASLCGVWLWRSCTLKAPYGVPMSLLVPALAVTTLLCKALGALALLVGGLGALWSTKVFRTRIPIFLLILAPVLYMSVRATGKWSGDLVVESVSAISEARAQSLQFRFENEDILAEKAWQRPLFGWGGWSRNRVEDEQGRDITVTDGLWIIVFGQHGLLGLISLYGVFLVPPLYLLIRCDIAWWSTANSDGPAVLSVLVLLFASDCLLNAMPNPVFVVVAGGVSAFATSIAQPHNARALYLSYHDRPGLGAGA